jgi:predicted dehydrogenase
MTLISTAVAGYGYWGPNLARVVQSCGTTALTAICDASEAARLRASSHYPNARITPDFDDLLAEDVDAVIVALPMRLHYEFALRALNAGKHVLVEKPLAMSVAHCDELIEVADERGLSLMVGHTFVFNGAVQRAKAYLTSGELGEPYYVSMRRTNLGIVRSDGNAMWNLAPHDIAILRFWLVADPVEVSATGAAHLQQGIEDAVFISIRFENGVVGHVHCSWLEPHKVRDATIVGSRKMLVFDDTAAESKLWLYDKGIDRRQVTNAGEAPSLEQYETFAQFQMIARAGDVLLPKLDLAEPLRGQIEHFADVISGRAESRASGHDGRAVVAVLEAAQRSLEERGAPQRPAGGTSV